MTAAAEVFFEQGYAATSIDSIIERTGGSKRNIYKEFGSKAGLFIALVSDTADEVLDALSDDGSRGRDLTEQLVGYARQLTTVYMSARLVGLLRVVMAEAIRFPDLAAAFYERGPGRAAARLVEILEEAKERGEIAQGDCQMAADQFCGMLRDNVHLQVVLGLRPALTTAEIEASATAAVRIFLDGIRVDASARPEPNDQ